MKKWILLLSALFLAPALLLAPAGSVFADVGSHEYHISPVPFTQVEVPNGFWRPRLDSVREETIPFSFKKCEDTGRISNFAKAGGLEEGKFQGIYYDDSDVYKVIEGAAYVLALQKDEKIDAYLDEIIAKIAAAQEPDGYLYSSRTIYQKAKDKNGQYVPPGGPERWTAAGGHELYCVGHLYEAAFAHYLATGKRNLLDVALKSANLICDTFGVGKSQNWPPGHQEIEIGLSKLYRLTGEKKYLDAAKYFLDIRGRKEGRTYPIYGAYNQDHLPVLEQQEAVGHAVRACYMYCGMADVAALTGDKAYSDAILRIWKDVVERKLYVTGGVGALPKGESFGPAYFLPNDSAYCETCAQIAAVFWAHRMFLDSGKAEYYDVLEKILYNALLSGINLDGNLFFYPNVLEVQSSRQRSPWFGTSCCPSNLCRFLASMPGYVYATKDDVVYVNLFTNSKTEIDAKVNGRNAKIALEQKTNYPWDGKIFLATKTNGRYTLKIRVPGWAQGVVTPGEEPLYSFLEKNTPAWSASLNGVAIEKPEIIDGFLTLTRDWKSGDAVALDFPMPVRRVLADERVEADRGKTAIQRGPIVFCVEQQDADTESLFALRLDDDAKISEKWEADELGGIMTLNAPVKEISHTQNSEILARDTSIRMIPYYAWAHREPRQMTVWLARENEAVKPLSFLTGAKINAAECVKDPQFMRDGRVPTDPADRNHPRLHWWPAIGASLWIEYRFPNVATVESVRIFWFDDRDYGSCRVPESWKLFYLDEDDQWKPVKNPSGFGVEYFKFNETRFEPVKTRGLRLEIQSQKEWAGGIYEWEVK